MKFLNLGVMSVVREIEYMRHIMKHHNPNMTSYMLGDIVVTCPKVNYKLNYQPGYVQCPRTKKEIAYSEVKDTLQVLANLPIYEKQIMPHI